MDRSTNFFAWVDDKDNPVRRLILTQELQGELSHLFLEQTKELANPDLELIPFDGRLAADDSQVLYIEKYPMPPEIWQALKEPMSRDPFALRTAIPQRVRAIFTGSAAGTPWVSFQVFERRQLLSQRGLAIIVSRGSFRKLEEPGLTVGDSITIHYLDGKLLFRSFHFARRILDLSDYYRDATSSEIQTLFKEGLASCTDPDEFCEKADSWTRRKLGLVMASGLLKSVAPDDIVQQAKEFDIAVETVKKGAKEAIVFPTDRRELKRLLRFLDEDYYEAPITGAKYVSNSKRRLNGAQSKGAA